MCLLLVGTGVCGTTGPSPSLSSLQLVTSDKGMQPKMLLDVWQQMVDTVVRMLLALDEKEGG